MAEFVITKMGHESCGPQKPPVAWATMRVYTVQRALTGNKEEDDMAAFEAFTIPTCNFKGEVLPIGTKLRIEVI
jgi:hypothetical protein